MFAKITNRVKNAAKSCKSTIKRGAMAVALFLTASVSTFAQNAAGDYSAGTTALSQVAEENAFWLNHTQTKYDKMNIKLKKTRYK